MGMFGELERIAELFGLRHNDIPAFLDAVIDVVDRYRPSAALVEDYHGKVPQIKGLT